MSRCGECLHCKDLERIKAKVLACANPPFSYADQDVVDVWNRELEELPCLRSKEKDYYVYIVRMNNGNYYTGIAKNPEVRAHQHNHTPRGAKALRGQRPVKLVWQTKAPRVIGDAMRLERRIKTLSHQEKAEIVATGVIPME